jgi:hypothetical protein
MKAVTFNTNSSQNISRRHSYAFSEYSKKSPTFYYTINLTLKSYKFMLIQRVVKKKTVI